MLRVFAHRYVLGVKCSRAQQSWTTKQLQRLLVPPRLCTVANRLTPLAAAPLDLCQTADGGPGVASDWTIPEGGCLASQLTCSPAGPSAIEAGAELRQ